ncbi:MAG: DUF5040 domain-containing protein [Prolixibacteraceae bacterium]|nr:DUF5040 domain-containing protein [Prolixibacteraceae bacterium]
MKNVFTFIVFAIIFSGSVFAQNQDTTQLLLTGASFADVYNGWFEFGCESLNAKPINRAVGGESIVHTAEKMNAGTLYSKAELENIDALIIMHVHEKDVFNDPKSWLRNKYSDYEFPMDMNNYVGAYDYVIKRYISDCYQLKFDSASAYFNAQAGKPAIIVLCTHWHDARVTFNTTVRQLAQKWGLPIIEFDKNIGFTKNEMHPVTNDQYSLIFSLDTQELDGVVYGWHPQRGDTYIQRKMAAIMVHKMEQVLLLYK